MIPLFRFQSDMMNNVQPHRFHGEKIHRELSSVLAYFALFPCDSMIL